MKWVALSVVLVGAAISLLAVLLPVSGTTEGLDAYESLRKAQGGLPESMTALDELAERDGALGWQARIVAARAHAAEADFARAAELLESALGLRSTTALRAELGTMLEAAGLRAQAKAEWEKLLPKSDAVDAMQRLEPDAVRLATILVTAGRYAEALPLVTPAKTDAARLARARALAGLGKPSDAVVEFAQYVATHASETAVRLEYGRAVERSGASDRALEIYRNLGAAGAYREGLLLESLGRTREAAEALQRSSDGEAQWRAGRLLEALGEAAGALKIYEGLAAGSHRARDDAALRAVLLLRAAGKPSQADKLVAGLPAAFRWILGSYSPPSFAEPSTIPSAEVKAVLSLASALAKRGHAEWAAGELEFAYTNCDAAGRLAVGQWFSAHGDARRAFQIGTELLAKTPSRAAYELAYPGAFAASVDRWASEYAVDRYLVLAVVREESNYLPTAVSSSNACGLMQLLPSTGKWIAESKCKLTYYDDILFVPDTNIRLGTWYIAYLTGYYDGDIVRAVAAYNGGNGNVDRWTAAAKATRRADVPGALVSTETREYLTKVLNSWLVYRALYATSPTS